jgi:glutamyl-tRNA reductase
MMHTIFFANKRVVQETAFRDGAASTAYASVDLAQQFIVNFRAPRILLIGLGEIGQNVAENFEGIEAAVTLTNRTYEKAAQKAHQLDFEAIEYSSALEQLDEYDVIISSVSVPNPIISKAHFNQISPKQKLLIDLGMPRSIADDTENIPGFILYNVDQLEEKTTSILKKREAAIPKVEGIVKESILSMKDWAQEMEVSPAIKKLKETLDSIRKEELARYMKSANEEEIKLLDKATKSIIQKVIKLPVLQLKAACKRGEAENMVGVLNDLFNLEQTTKKEADS